MPLWPRPCLCTLPAWLLAPVPALQAVPRSLMSSNTMELSLFPRAYWDGFCKPHSWPYHVLVGFSGFKAEEEFVLAILLGILARRAR